MSEDRQMATVGEQGIQPVAIPDTKPVMQATIAQVEATRAATLRAMQLDTKLQDAFLALMRDSNGTYLVAYGDRVELNADGVALFARAMELDVLEIPEAFRVVQQYVGESSGRQEWIVCAACEAVDTRTGRRVRSMETCSSEDSIHSYKERMVDGNLVAQRSYGERFQMVHAHALTRAMKDAIDKLVGFPTLSKALCDKLGLRYQGIEYGKGKYGGKDKPQAEPPKPQQPKPEPKPDF